MEGEPEGSNMPTVRPPRWLIVFVVIFAIYLIFRIVQLIIYFPQIIHWLSVKL